MVRISVKKPDERFWKPVPIADFHDVEELTRDKTDVKRVSSNERIKFTILGQPYSKANRRRFVRAGLIIKSREAMAYVEYAALQLPRLRAPLEGPLGISAVIYYASRRPDLDPSLLFDVLQGRMIVNDRQLEEQHLYKKIDKSNPRSEIEIWRLIQ